MNLSTATPREVDEAIAEQYGHLYRLREPSEDVMRAGGAKRLYGRGAQWSMSFADALAAAREAAVDQSAMAHERDYAARIVARWDEFVAQRDVIHAEIRRLGEEFTRRGGWTRAHLVTDGHVHSSMSCSTCNNGEAPTQFTWLVEFSGRTEAEVVEAAANRACTVCYPSAPVDTAGESRLMTPDERTRAEQRADAAKAKAERQAAKVAKALTTDGSEFKVTHPGYRPDSVQTERFKTERAATTWAVDAIVSGSHGHEDKMPAVLAIVDAVAEKHSKPVDQVKAEFNAKAEAKRKRDQWPAQVAITL